MIKESTELIIQRKNEIIDACAALYQTKGFREVTIKDISQKTSISRPSIYNYFETKEEIFLADGSESWSKSVFSAGHGAGMHSQRPWPIRWKARRSC